MQLISAIYFRLICELFMLLTRCLLLQSICHPKCALCDTPLTKCINSFLYSCPGDCFHWPLPVHV
jgi:hypothetical protein